MGTSCKKGPIGCFFGIILFFKKFSKFYFFLNSIEGLFIDKKLKKFPEKIGIVLFNRIYMMDCLSFLYWFI